MSRLRRLLSDGATERIVAHGLAQDLRELPVDGSVEGTERVALPHHVGRRRRDRSPWPGTSFPCRSDDRRAGRTRNRRCPCRDGRESCSRAASPARRPSRTCRRRCCDRSGSSGCARRSRPQPVHRAAEIGQRAEEMVEMAIGPVEMDREHGQLRLSSARVELPHRLPAAGRETVIRAAPAAMPAAPRGCRPALCSRSGTKPAAARNTAGTCCRRSSRPPVDTSRIRPSSRAGRRPAGRPAAGGTAFDRVPGQHVRVRRVDPVREERLPRAAHLEPHMGGVSVDQLRRVSIRRGGGTSSTTRAIHRARIFVSGFGGRGTSREP